MKKEKQYADELIEQYEELTKYGHLDDKIKAEKKTAKEISLELSTNIAYVYKLKKQVDKQI